MIYLWIILWIISSIISYISIRLLFYSQNQNWTMFDRIMNILISLVGGPMGIIVASGIYISEKINLDKKVWW